MAANIIWRDDIEAVEVEIPGHVGKCFMHRLAFRALMTAPASAETCLAFAMLHIAVLQTAALAKIERNGGDAQRNISITSRDFRRAQVPVASTTDTKKPPA